MSRILILGGALAAILAPAAIAQANTVPTGETPFISKQAVEDGQSDQFARRGRGADDAPGDDRRGRGRGTDDGPNHA
jgi:hypothetical protein